MNEKDCPLHLLSDVELARWIMGQEWPDGFTQSKRVEFGGQFIPESWRMVTEET